MVCTSFDENSNAFLLAKKVEGCSKKTLGWYKFGLDRFRIWLKENAPLDTITTDRVRQYFADASALAQATLAGHQRCLRSFFKWCVAEGRLETDPMLPIKKLKVSKELPKMVSFETVDKLLKACSQTKYEGIRHYAMISVFVDTAMRLNELICLKPGDLDMEKHTIIVRRGKGGKFRTVFIQHKAHAALRKWLKIRSAPLDCALFCTRDGKGLESRNVAWILRRLAKKAGITEPVSPHRLRHLSATIAAGGGMNAFQLAEMLGHSDLKTTMIYTHLGGQVLQEAHAKVSPLEKILNGA